LQRFHFDLQIKNQILLDTDTVSAVLHPVLFALFLCALFHSGCSVPSFFLGTIPFHCLAAPFFYFPEKMSETNNGQTVAAAASTQVKLCLYDEGEPAIWFRLIRAQFTTAGIKSQKLRYTMLWPVCPSKSFGTF
jgi:hypothetical protein